MKMTTEKAQSVLMQLVRYHYGLIDVPPTNIDIEEAHFFIKTQLSVAQRFEGAVELNNAIGWVERDGVNTYINHFRPPKSLHTLYLIPKENK